MHAFQFPRDFRESPQFVQLRAELGSEGAAAVAWLYLWRMLSYLANEGGLPGILLPDHHKMLEYEWQAAGIPEEKAHAIIPLLRDKIRMLLPHTDGLICPRFVADNATAHMTFRTKGQRGADVKTFNASEKKARLASQLEQTLLSNPALWVSGAGAPLDADTVKRVRYCVRCVDGALFRPDREEWSWRADVVQNALAVTGRYTDEQIADRCKTISFFRMHPALHGYTTERLLPEFSEITDKLKAQM